MQVALEKQGIASSVLMDGRKNQGSEAGGIGNQEGTSREGWNKLLALSSVVQSDTWPVNTFRKTRNHVLVCPLHYSGNY